MLGVINSRSMLLDLIYINVYGFDREYCWVVLPSVASDRAYWRHIALVA